MWPKIRERELLICSKNVLMSQSDCLIPFLGPESDNGWNKRLQKPNSGFSASSVIPPIGLEVQTVWKYMAGCTAISSVQREERKAPHSHLTKGTKNTEEIARQKLKILSSTPRCGGEYL